MNWEPLLNALFDIGHRVTCKGDLLSGNAEVHGCTVAVVGTTNHAAIGVELALAQAGVVLETVREHPGLLPYEPYFYPRLTGREYLAFCLQARGRPVADFTGWNQLLELPLDQYADEYSAGMRKKLALLALLVQRFNYLILDEPFNGLDLEANLLLKAILKRLRDRGTGILLTSHILGALTETCDEISVLVAGRVQRQYAA